MQTDTKSFTVIIDANGFRSHIAGIHATGCADIERHPNPGAYKAEVEGTLRDALDVAVDPQDRDMGYGDDDAKVFPCVK